MTDSFVRINDLLVPKKLIHEMQAYKDAMEDMKNINGLSQVDENQLDLPNLFSGITQRHIDKLNFEFHDAIWSNFIYNPNFDYFNKELLLIALKLDVRRYISVIIYNCPNVLFQLDSKYYKNAITICIENCNGYTLNVIKRMQMFENVDVYITLIQLADLLIKYNKREYFRLYKVFSHKYGVSLKTYEYKYKIIKVDVNDIEKYKIRIDAKILELIKKNHIPNQTYNIYPGKYANDYLESIIPDWLLNESCIALFDEYIYIVHSNKIRLLYEYTPAAIRNTNMDKTNMLVQCDDSINLIENITTNN